MEYDIGARESTSTAVVRAVSAVQGCEPDELEPLSDCIQPDALDELFTTLKDGTPRTGGRVSFVYGGCRISVDNGEYLTIEPLDEQFIPARQIEGGTD